MSLDRDIVRLAAPALGALIAEPLFLLTDTALVGHLGAAPLAGLGIASVMLQTALGLLVFLAYATTPAVARRLGAGDRTGAVRAGIDGIWFALIVGAVLVAVGLVASRAVVGAFGPDPEVAESALLYLRISIVGLPAMLVVIAATGLLRGLQDTRTPLVVAIVGFTVNGGLNALLIYGFGLGISGSAWGTVAAQWGMAAVYAAVAARAARSVGAPLGPGLAGVGRTASSGAWLLVRNAALRLAMVATTVVATSFGTRDLAAVQIALTVFSTLAFALDALAIAGQALIGHALGAGDAQRVRAITGRLLVWGVAGGCALGLVVAALSPVAPALFTGDQHVRAELARVLLVLSAGIPVAGFVFVLDGVLLGAGDARYLALTGVLDVAAYLPLLLLAHDPVGLWWAFGLGYVGARAVTLGLRARSSRWIRVGASPVTRAAGPSSNRGAARS